MNLRLLKLTLLLLLAGFVADVTGQGVQELTVLENETLSLTILSRFQPALGRNPNNGTATLTADPDVPLSWNLEYTPDTDYTGADNMLLVSFPLGFNVAFTEYKLSVVKADIVCRHDFASTAANVAVSIPVLTNDSVNIGSITLNSSPVVNSGTVEVVGDEIVFTPKPGFVGLTDLNYVACSDLGVCDLGTVSINVLPTTNDMPADTVRVFTKRNQPQFIFAPEGATPAAPPASGSMVLQNGVMAYQPDQDFVGDEYLSYSLPGTGSTTVYHVTVLDLQQNFFAVEDRAYTAVNTDTKLNVLHNDIYNVFADCVNFSAPQFGTLTETARKGEVIYTPPTGWSGVDKFTYTSMSPGCAGEAEQQAVYIFVSNFAPAAEEANLTTPAGTPVVLTYSLAGGDANWTVVSAPLNGTIVTDTETGQLSYLPSASAAGQTDQLSLLYCLNADEDGNCAFSETVTISISVTESNADACADEDCVWPGDTNNDGVVDVGDLLPIGFAMGRTGTPRLGADPTGWSSQYAEDWTRLSNGLNLKHIDANGDQVISHLDTQTVIHNLGLRHALRPEPIDFTPFEISLKGPLTAEPGDLVSFDIMAGNQDVVIIDLIGFRAAFNYDLAVVDPSSVHIAFDESSWASYDSPILSLQHNDGRVGKVDAAVTRTSSLPVSGYGQLGKFEVVIIDLIGFRETYDGPTQNEGGTIITEIGGGENATVMNAAGHLNAAKVNPFQLQINTAPATEVGDFEPLQANNYLDEKLLAYPNPTNGNLTVHLNGQQRFSALQLTDLTGRTLRTESGLDTNHRELNLGDLPNGIYTLTLTTTDGVVNRKVEVLR